MQKKGEHISDWENWVVFFSFTQSFNTHNSLLILASVDVTLCGGKYKNAKYQSLFPKDLEVSKIHWLTQNDRICIIWLTFAEK